MIPDDWATLDSTSVDSMKYVAVDAMLYVKFKNGATYVYERVSPEIAEDFYHSSSPGKFVAEELRPNHPYRRA